jgi:hypothetical protein
VRSEQPVETALQPKGRRNSYQCVQRYRRAVLEPLECAETDTGTFRQPLLTEVGG